jgi:hypothetical protein
MDFYLYRVESGGVVVETLRYKLEGRGFDSRWCHWIFFIDIILPALSDVLEKPTIYTDLYHCFILSIGSYMFRQ